MRREAETGWAASDDSERIGKEARRWRRCPPLLLLIAAEEEIEQALGGNPAGAKVTAASERRMAPRASPDAVRAENPNSVRNANSTHATLTR